MKAIMVMYDSLNLRKLSVYGCPDVKTPNFDRLAQHAVTFDNCYIGSMPCMPARRELHTGRYNFMHRSWGPIEPFDDSMPEILKKHDIYTHLASDHQHYWEDGGATYHTRYDTWSASRGQEGDPWKPQVAYVQGVHRNKPASRELGRMMKQYGMGDMEKQDMVNRSYLTSEEDMPQAVTFANGLEFLEKNHDEDNWFLQIETFDPHEPFFASQRFKEMYPDPDDYTGPEFDWPSYVKVTETEEVIRHCRNQYAALLSMCDYYLGTVLDAMDKYDLWKDTMLIVNTDHGFLLGEHDWWGKSVMPYWNEVAHIPFFIWDPRSKKMGERRQALVQNIDVAPTLLTYFGLEPTKDMLGHDLARTIEDDTPVRQYALFGSHGNHINITDGKTVYMRAPLPGAKLYEYTLMPTHMRWRFSTEELQGWQPSRAFSFTKGLQLMKIETTNSTSGSSARFGSMLYDLDQDPGELAGYRDYEKEAELSNEIIHLMKENDAPEELYARFGFPQDDAVTAETLAQIEASLDSNTVEGFDGMIFDRKAYLAISSLLPSMPKESIPQAAEGIRQICAATQSEKVTTDVLKTFVESIPMDNAQKEMLIGMLFSE